MAKARIPKKRQKVIAKEHLKAVFTLAKEKRSDKNLTNKLIKLARKIAMKVRMRLPLNYKRQYCKHCYSYQTPGTNQRVRIQNKKVVLKCQECNKFTRIPITPKRKQTKTKKKGSKNKKTDNRRKSKSSSKRQRKN